MPDTLNNSHTENKMGVMPVGKLLASMSAPMVASMLFQALYNIVDSVFVARLSQDALNAVSLAFPLQSLCIAFANGTGIGVNTLLSKALGSKDKETADEAANKGIFLFLMCGVFFAVFGLLFGRAYFVSITSNPVITDYGTDYIYVCLGCSIMLFTQICGERLLQSTGRTNLAMIPQLSGAITNMILDPILIFGLFGFPRLEVKGAAVATVFGQTLATALGIWLNIRKNPEITLSLKKIRFSKKTAQRIYSIGLPSIIMQGAGSVLNFLMNKILIGFTEAATAVYGAYFKIQSFIFLPVIGINNALVPIISYNYGAKRPSRVKGAVKYGIIFAVSIMTFGCLLFELIPDKLLSIFSPSEEMLTIGIRAFRIIGLHFPVAGFCILAGSICQALEKPLYSLITNLIRQLVVLLPAAWLLSLSGILDNVWYAFLIAETVSLALNFFFIRSTFRQRLN